MGCWNIVFAMTSAFSLQNFVLLHFILQGQTCLLLQVSLDILLKKKINNLNWRQITLRYCGGFCHTLTSVSHGCTCVPLSQTPLQLPSPSHPSGLSQYACFECPVSCIELGQVICFTDGYIHVSVLFCHIIPTLVFSHRVQKSVLYICVSLLLCMGSSLPCF